MLLPVSTPAAIGRASPPPVFLALVGHPVRWRLLRHLADGDLQVRELTALVDERQSVVSYHLGLLRAAGMVLARQSSADHRGRYYGADLGRCGELLAAAGAALHPGLGTARFSPPPPPPVGLTARVLFLCTHNSARSQMAEALLRRYAGDGLEVLSAGSQPTRLHPNTVRVMAARGINLSSRRAKQLDEFVGQRFDAVVTVCDRVREACPTFPGARRMLHWSIADPSEDGGAGDEATLPAFERTADELAARIPFLVRLLADGNLEES